MAKSATATKSAPAKQITSSDEPVYTKLAKAYKVACPIVTLATADPGKALTKVCKALESSDVAVILWDVARGFTIPQQPKFEEAKAAAAKASLTPELFSLEMFLAECEKLPKGVAVVIFNAHRFLDRPEVVQAVWNLRDPFKSPKRMLILMGTAFRVPAELQHDVIELDEPLPNSDEIKGVVRTLCESTGVEMNDDHIEDAAAASRGLSAFAAEQLAALNFSRGGGVSVQGVWADKCSKINETPGLKVISGGTFEDVAGVEQAKRFVTGILGGRDKPRTIVFMDEIEKALGGASGDTSGVAQDQLGVLLQFMQDKRAAGMILVGPPGAAKSAFAKASGGEAGIPTIQFDLGGMKDSLVGGSEARIRDALKVIDAVSGGKTLWIATCNSLSALPPELRRRFKYGTWFFDLPTRDERAAIWTLYTEKFELGAIPEAMLDCEWTGAEIESCCEIAWRTNCTVAEAAAYIVPVSKAGAAQIAELRNLADGKFLSASHSGTYSRSNSVESVSSGRDID